MHTQIPFCVDRKFAGRRQLVSDPKTYVLHSCADFFGGSYIRDTGLLGSAESC